MKDVTVCEHDFVLYGSDEYSAIPGAGAEVVHHYRCSQCAAIWIKRTPPNSEFKRFNPSRIWTTDQYIEAHRSIEFWVDPVYYEPETLLDKLWTWIWRKV